MTEEELQAKILEHEKTIETLNTTINSYNEQEQTFKTNIETLTNDISKLKEHNMTLFLKLTDQEKQTNNINQQNNPNPKPENKQKNIDDIIKLMQEKE